MVTVYGNCEANILSFYWLPVVMNLWALLRKEFSNFDFHVLFWYMVMYVFQWFIEGQPSGIWCDHCDPFFSWVSIRHRILPEDHGRWPLHIRCHRNGSFGKYDHPGLLNSSILINFVPFCHSVFCGALQSSSVASCVLYMPGLCIFFQIDIFGASRDKETQTVNIAFECFWF